MMCEAGVNNGELMAVVGFNGALDKASLISNDVKSGSLVSNGALLVSLERACAFPFIMVLY